MRRLILPLLLVPLVAHAGQQERALHEGLHAAVEDPSRPPPAAMFSEEDIERLDQGEALFGFQRVRGHDLIMGTKVAEATPEAMWERILELPSYPAFMPVVAAGSLDRKVKVGDRWLYAGTFELEIPGFPAVMTIESSRVPGSGYMPFHLKSGFRNPFRHLVGYWSVIPYKPGTVIVQLQMDAALDMPISTKRRRAFAERTVPELLMGMALLAEGRL